MKEYHKWKKEIRTCKICDKKFKPDSNRQMFCNKQCRYKYYKDERKMNEWKPKKYKCIVCDKIFVQKTSCHKKNCSPSCLRLSQTHEWKIKNIEKLSTFNEWDRLRFEIFKRDDFTCQYCGRNIKKDKIKLCCDHIVPRSKGGRNTIENLTTSCEDCNLGKSDVLLSNKLQKTESS